MNRIKKLRQSLQKFWKMFSKLSGRKKVAYLLPKIGRTTEILIVIATFAVMIWYPVLYKSGVPTFPLTFILGIGANRFVHYYMLGISKRDYKRGLLEGEINGRTEAQKRFEPALNQATAYIHQLENTLHSLGQTTQSLQPEVQPSKSVMLSRILGGGENKK